MSKTIRNEKKEPREKVEVLLILAKRYEVSPGASKGVRVS